MGSHVIANLAEGTSDRITRFGMVSLDSLLNRLIV